MEGRTTAPGAPGIEARWTSSAKEAVGTAHSAASPVWFTLSHGILNEVYYPRLDKAAIRDAQFLVVTPDGRFVDPKRDCSHSIRSVAPGVPAFDVEFTDPGGSFEITQRYVTDPIRPVVLIDVTYDAVDSAAGDHTLVFLVAPHLGNQGAGNTAWVDTHKGTPVVFAQRDDIALAIAVDAPVLGRSVGYVGISDAWQDLSTNRAFTKRWDLADNGNVAISLQPDLEGCEGVFTAALGFGRTPAEAAHHVISSLRDGFPAALDLYRSQWDEWNTSIRLPSDRAVVRASALVLATHEATTLPGASIASLSVPWGSSKGDQDLGGYHLVWPRDHVETAGALFAIGAVEEGLRALSYLRATQEADGHWAQNMWLDGSPYWGGIQIDETALPILLVDIARTAGALDAPGARDAYWPMVRAAAAYVAANGPVTGQDRWEEDGGYSPFTLATEIAALLLAAEMADRRGESAAARYLRETADCWDAHIETWCYARDTKLSAEAGVDGYYVRIGAADNVEAPVDGWVNIKNRPAGRNLAPADAVVSPDALALVRFGIRSPDDPHIFNTIKVIDATLQESFPFGPGWRRYTGDGYGEHPDGRPFDGTGIGRVWPLLTGERAHYELAAGRVAAARELIATLEAMAQPSGLIPEQVWDGPDIPERELVYGMATGSARPLVWAHAEYLKLLRSVADGKIFDLPSVVQGHEPDPVAAARRFWRANHKITRIETGVPLRIELTEPATVHWSLDHWRTTTDTATNDSGIGMHYVDFPASSLPATGTLVFTIRRGDTWSGTDYQIEILEGSGG
ncbi:MAG: glycoside hydrolase family 15 protein [Acidimicrobiia bacterium]